MAKGNIIKALEELDKKDIYSVILFCLYKLKNNEKYSTLSELIYILDNDNFIKFINYFGGKKFTVSTINELSNILNALLVLEQMENNDIDIDTAMKNVNIKNIDKKYILENIDILKQILTEYDFTR